MCIKCITKRHDAEPICAVCLKRHPRYRLLHFGESLICHSCDVEMRLLEIFRETAPEVAVDIGDRSERITVDERPPFVLRVKP